MTTWYAQLGSLDISPFVAFKSTIWNDAANGLGNFMGNGTSDTFLTALGSGDILCANAKTALDINAGFTCLRLSTAAEGGTAGGGFTIVGAANFTINAKAQAGTTTCLAITSGTITTLTLNGNAAGGSAAYTYGINLNTSGTNMIFTGDVYAGSAVDTPGIVNGGSSSCIIIGNIIHNTSSAAMRGAITYNPSSANYITYPKTGGTQNYYPNQMSMPRVRVGY
jgi:hypothetical protein